MNTDPGRSPLHQRLRDETAAEHRALEAALDLLGRADGAAAVRALLARFHGFHAAWEPALEARLAEPALTVPRRKLPALRADLAVLGLAPAAVDALPRCEPAADLAADVPAALGGFYVMEGATLGGKVISRHLAAQPWWPAGGLRYFDPYAEHTGRHWRETLARLDAAPPASHAAVVAGAQAAFALLQRWLISYTRDAPAPA